MEGYGCDGYGWEGYRERVARSLHSQILHPLGPNAIMPTLYDEIQFPICMGFSSEKDGDVDSVWVEAGTSLRTYVQDLTWHGRPGSLSRGCIERDRQ